MDVLSWLTVDDLAAPVASLLGTPIARMAYTGSPAMRYLVGPLRSLPPVLASGHAKAAIEGMFGISYEAFRERVDRHNAWAHERADEFRRLLATVALTDTT